MNIFKMNIFKMNIFQQFAEYERKKAIEDAKQAEEAKKNPAQVKQAPKPVAKGKVEEKPLIDVPKIPVP